jgi:uncharacterized Zn finger protein (UPF0148 family)
MPCYRCGTRQVDPARGPSPWKRGVRENRQVLICPRCQSGRDWASDLDRCPDCGGTRLVRRLGEVECRDCGQVRESAGTPAADAPAPVDASAATGQAAGEGAARTATEDPAAAGDSAATEDPAAALAEDVARALDRVLGSNRVSG